ncbi:hypothetical protein ACLPJK_26210 [Pseudomonas aeruginosa]|uniref:hypothetical protein n=1 Tax=Pseudomonas aeruginosa TaxID=287 RepID=UPI003D2A9FE8
MTKTTEALDVSNQTTTPAFERPVPPVTDGHTTPAAVREQIENGARRTAGEGEQDPVAMRVVNALAPSLNKIRADLLEATNAHFSHLLQSNEFISTLAANVLRSAADALVFRAQYSEQSQGVYEVLRTYVPGSYRCIMYTDGSLLVEHQLREAAEAGKAGDGWEPAPINESPVGMDAVRTLLLTASVEPDRYYYMITTAALAAYKRQASLAIDEAAG